MNKNKPVSVGELIRYVHLPRIGKSEAWFIREFSKKWCEEFDDPIAIHYYDWYDDIRDNFKSYWYDILYSYCPDFLSTKVAIMLSDMIGGTPEYWTDAWEETFDYEEKLSDDELCAVQRRYRSY